MDNYIDLLVNPNKIQNHIPKINKNNTVDKYKENIINNVKSYNINFNKTLNNNEVLDLLFFIEYHNKFKNELCNECKKKINELK